MALSHSFYGLRRGSTKSHTYNIYRGQQVTKERVYDVANPQTTAQLKQRLKMPVVSQSRAILKELVNHSFEGVTYGDQSLEYFSRENLARNDLSITEYVPKGISDPGVANLLISKGNLPSPTIIVSETTVRFSLGANKQMDEIEASVDAIGNPAKGDLIPQNYLEFLRNVFQTSEEGQLTFLIQYQGASYTFNTSATETTEGHFHRFIVGRLILDRPKALLWKFVEKQDGTPTLYKYTDGYLNLTLMDYESDDQDFYLEISPAATSKICAATVIVSDKENGTWKRSTQRLQTGITTTTQTFENVQYSYLNAKTLVASSKYLNTGTDGVGIEGSIV